MDRYAVVGQPITHSQSPFIHQFFAQATHQEMVYERLGPELEDFEACVATFFANGGKGLNVTLPFKERACVLADRLSERARLAKAANTLWIEEGLIHADNTDGIGLVADLEFHGVTIQNKRLVIFGAGGAVRGVLGPLVAAQPREILIVNRSQNKAQDIIQELRGSQSHSATQLRAGGLDDESLSSAYDLIINATSASLKGEGLTYPQGVFSQHSVAYDMTYGHLKTDFMRQASQYGVVACFDGLGMLIEQAAQSFYIWRHVRPPTQELRTILRQRISS